MGSYRRAVHHPHARGRALHMVRRHAWQFHGAGVMDAVAQLEATCVCTHPYSTHNVNGLCIALPGVLGCGCLGWSEVRP